MARPSERSRAEPLRAIYARLDEAYAQEHWHWYPEHIQSPFDVIAGAVLIALGAVAAWGILESVLIASVFTLIEVGGLALIVVAGLQAGVPVAAVLTTPPPLEPAVLSGIGYASLLAFFAFIGFEDLANVVEEAKVPHRDIPRAMVLTLIVSTLLYLLVAAISVAAARAP